MPFPKYKYHVCLVSDQTLPNYLGSIMPEASPETVHLIVTELMKERAEILKNALRERRIAVECHHLADGTRQDAMLDVLDDLWRKLPHEDIAINVTGGTKIMALAAVEWAGIQDDPPFLFYVDTSSKKILQVSRKMEEFDMRVKLKIKELLKAGKGVEIDTPDASPVGQQTRTILECMAETFLQDSTALELFNKCAAEARTSLYTDMPNAPSMGFKKALELAEKAEKLRQSPGKITYKSEEARFWCNGGWFEEYVHARLYKLKNDGVIDDWGKNIEIPTDGKSASHSGQFSQNSANELDAAFTSANRLFIIECKTANLSKKDAFSAAAYKLNTLTKTLGGSFSRGMIASVHNARSEDRKRCGDLGIRLLCGKDALKLEEAIKKWIK